MINYCAKRLSIFCTQRVAWCVYSLLLLLLLLSNQFFVIPICLVTFLQLWCSSRFLLQTSPSPHNLPIPNFHQYFPIIFSSCVFVCRPSIERVKEYFRGWESELDWSTRMKSRINIEWNVLGGHSRRWFQGGKKNVNFNSRDFENVMVMPLWIEVLHTMLKWKDGETWRFYEWIWKVAMRRIKFDFIWHKYYATLQSFFLSIFL